MKIYKRIIPQIMGQIKIQIGTYINGIFHYIQYNAPDYWDDLFAIEAFEKLMGDYLSGEGK